MKENTATTARNTSTTFALASINGLFSGALSDVGSKQYWHSIRRAREYPDVQVWHLRQGLDLFVGLLVGSSSFLE